MPQIRIDQWKEAVAVIPFFRQSQALKDVTQKFEVYAQRPTQGSLENLATFFRTWKSTQAGEVAKLASAVQDLEDTITAAKGSNVVIKDKATQVTNVGYTFVDDLDGDTPLPPDQCLPPLTPSEIARINEAFRRSKAAVEAARDAMLVIAAKKSLGSPPSATEKLYTDYFGAFTPALAKEVLENFKTLCKAFTSTPEVVDHRNTDFGEDCYAACKRAKKTVGVRVWIGREFVNLGKSQFKKTAIKSGDVKERAQALTDSYASTSDATVDTLVHEFAHGSFAAVDAPPVRPDGSWSLTPRFWNADPSLCDRTKDNYGASPNNNVQASQKDTDKALAARYPDVAVRNADCYGQFALGCLLLNAGA